MTIRDQTEILIRKKGIDPFSCKNVIGPLTGKIRSLRLLCFGITPKILLQTIEKQKSNGLKETDPAVKILRTLHLNLVKFEEEVGFPIKLVKSWARVKTSTSRDKQQPITVGTREIHPTHQPEKLEKGRRGKIRMNWLKRGVGRIYRLRAGEGKKVQVENRLTSIPMRPIRAIFRRVSKPILKRIGKTTIARTAKIAFRKAKRKITKTIWKIGKKGLGKVAKEGVKLLTTKLAATKIGAALGSVVPVVGNAAGAAIGFVVDKTLGVVKKLASKIPRFFRSLVSGGSKRGTKIINGVSGLMEEFSNGKAFFGDSKVLQGVFLLVFLLIPILAIFGNMQTSSALIREPIETETRYTGPPGDLHRHTMASQDLENLFTEVADQYCVPMEMLLAVSQVEASGIWDYSDSEVARFSTSNWWDDAECDLTLDVIVGSECNRGYCYDTCKITGLCPSYSVVGPMQFEKGTWDGYKDRLEIALGHLPNRCNLQDSLFAAAMKIKANSGTNAAQCANWDQNTVESAARAYCGSCGWKAECGGNPPPGCVNQHKACGANYCQAVWMLYNEY